MQISCNAAQDLVVLYHEDSLSPATKAEIDTHLKECKICQSFYQAYHKMNQKDIPTSVSDFDTMPDYASLAKKLKRRRIAHRSFWTAGIVTGTLLGCGASYLIFNRRK